MKNKIVWIVFLILLIIIVGVTSIIFFLKPVSNETDHSTKTINYNAIDKIQQ